MLFTMELMHVTDVKTLINKMKVFSLLHYAATFFGCYNNLVILYIKKKETVFIKKI